MMITSFILKIHQGLIHMLVAKTIGWLNHEVPKLSLLSFINQARQDGRDQTTLSGEMLHMNASLGSSVQNRNTQFT